MTQEPRTDDQLDPVAYICVTPEHIAAGKNVPDGHGTVSVNGRRWAYCSAGLKNAPHDWQETGGVALGSIRHADLPIAPPKS